MPGSALVAELADALVLGASGLWSWGFESPSGHMYEEGTIIEYIESERYWCSHCDNDAVDISPGDKFIVLGEGDDYMGSNYLRFESLVERNGCKHLFEGCDISTVERNTKVFT